MVATTDSLLVLASRTCAAHVVFDEVAWLTHNSVALSGTCMTELRAVASYAAAGLTSQGLLRVHRTVRACRSHTTEALHLSGWARTAFALDVCCRHSAGKLTCGAEIVVAGAGTVTGSRCSSRFKLISPAHCEQLATVA